MSLRHTCHATCSEHLQVLQPTQHGRLRGVLWTSDDLCRRDVSFELLNVSLQLGASVLEPRDHLRVGETQLRGDLVTVGWREVLLVQKAFFQFVDLLVGECSSTFASFL